MKELSRLAEQRKDAVTYFGKMVLIKHQWGVEDTAKYNLSMMEGLAWEMAKKIAVANGKDPKKKAEFKGFANVELSIDQKSEMKEWIGRNEEVMVELDEMTASGYKMGFQRSEATGGYQATAFCQDPSSPNAGYILSAFAPHWFDALACLAFKHAIICEGVWPNKDDSRGDLWG